MNNVSLIGRLTRDPELKEIGGGRSVCELRLAAEGVGRRESEELALAF